MIQDPLYSLITSEKFGDKRWLASKVFSMLGRVDIGDPGTRIYSSNA